MGRLQIYKVLKPQTSFLLLFIYLIFVIFCFTKKKKMGTDDFQHPNSPADLLQVWSGTEHLAVIR